jgi:heptosyltransferase I
LKKVLLIRLDKIGDLICTLPADQILDESRYDVTWAVQKGLGAVVDLGEKKRRYIELDKNNPVEARTQLAAFLKQNSFDYVISFQCPWWVNFELFKARIAFRAGVLSQWHSFLFLNAGLRQKRSKAIKHELEYNLDIVRATFNLHQNKEFIYFHIPKPSSIEVLIQHQLQPSGYIVVHPGMMGSALNWSQAQYIEKIDELIKAGKKIVITGTPGDDPYLTDIKLKFSKNTQVIWLQSKLNLPELVQVLANAEFVIVPSTGVAHLSASVGATVKAIFSPVRVQSPTRWAPRGPNVEIWMIEAPENNF